ncbi:MAG: C25 family cysteine peptidase, partial [Promethearchaeota archaeon]
MFEKAKRLAKSKNKKMIAGAAFITMILIATFLQIGADKPLTNTREESDFTQAFLDPPIPPENKIELELSISDLVVEDIYLNEDVYKRISIDDCGYIGQVGHPKLPFKTLKILLPYGKDLDKVNVVPSERYTLDGKFKIEPAQAQIPFGTDEIPKFALAESIYQSANLFPENIYSVEGVYELRGYRILILNIYPVQYIPNTAEISYFKDMKVQVSVSDNTLANSLFRGFYVDEERVISAVDNPEIINTYKGNKEEGKNLPSSSGLSPDSYDYVIITNEALKNSGGAYTFQDLADYKIAHGIQTTIVTVEYIYANYPGDDEQEKIRNFIIDAYQTWNIRYVLLGGDGDGANLGGESEDPIIPARGFYATAYGEVDYNIPSDLYYSGLDGTWDDDGDGIYGEDGEEDFYAEVYVGRAPVDSEEEVSNFVMKTLIHEQINDEYLSKALMVGEDLG